MEKLNKTETIQKRKMHRNWYLSNRWYWYWWFNGVIK